jgi:hypothetical protein
MNFIDVNTLFTPQTYGYYDDLCDLCLFDRHYCPTCQDVVGHNHTHDDNV